MPNILTDFYTTLLSGTRTQSKQSGIRNRLVQSFSEDVIYAISNGRIKTAKHVTLAIAVKSLTSSRRLVDIFNRLGHCCSFTVIEELETEATFCSNEETQICPDDIIKKPNLSTGLAFNNFDRYVETLIGKNTLHDTVGIILQDIQDEVLENEEISIDESSEGGNIRKRKRRAFDAITKDLQAYAKKPKIVEVLQVLPDDTCHPK